MMKRYVSNTFVALAIAFVVFGLFWAVAGQVFVGTQDAFSLVLGLTWSLAVLFVILGGLTA